MRVLVDTNVVLDVLLNREPWVQIACALANDFDYIVTRNIRDFDHSNVPALTPGELLQRRGGDRP